MMPAIDKIRRRLDAFGRVMRARGALNRLIGDGKRSGRLVVEPGTRCAIAARLFDIGPLRFSDWVRRDDGRFRREIKGILSSRIDSNGPTILFRGDAFDLEVPAEFQNSLSVLLNDLLEVYFLNTYSRLLPFGLPGRDAVVLDCGANIGAFSVWLATRGTNARVVAFEPDAAIAAVLRRNISRNGVSGSIAVEEVCLGDREGTVELFRDHEVFTVTRVASTVESGRAGTTSNVPLRTIDSIVARLGLDRVDWIKMDIEGAERSALRGAADTVRRFRPRLSLSGYHLVDDIDVLCKGIWDICPDYDIVVSRSLEIYASAPGPRPASAASVR